MGLYPPHVTLPIWGPPPPRKEALREHLNKENSSVKKHIYSWQNKDCKGLDVKIIMSENDPANLRLYEAYYIRKCKPTLIPEKNVLNSQTFYFSILF